MSVKTPANPSRTATARVKNPLPAPTECHYCTGEVVIAHHRDIYGRAFGHWPWAYLCSGCGAYVGMHPFTAIPLGTLADEKTRHARKVCKPAFERLWGAEGWMTRKEAYAALAAELGIPVGECHFGWFDAAMCERAEQACRRIAQRQGPAWKRDLASATGSRP